jgi:hypothetical protein
VRVRSSPPESGSREQSLGQRCMLATPRQVLLRTRCGQVKRVLRPAGSGPGPRSTGRRYT